MNSDSSISTSDEFLSRALVKKAISDLGFSFVAYRGSSLIYSSKSDGVLPVFTLVNKNLNFINNFYGMYLGDRVIGKASALLITILMPRYVFGKTISLSAKDVLEQHKIPFEFETLTPVIKNRGRTDICPFEKAVLNTKDPLTALSQISTVLSSFKKPTI